MDATLVEGLSKVVYLPAVPEQADEQLAVAGRNDMPEQEKPKGWAILQKKADGGSATRATTYRVRPARMEGYVLPVVRLPQQMASCSICLNDFVEGRKITEGDVGVDGLENALRFLDCGHVFHVSRPGFVYHSDKAQDDGSFRSNALINGSLPLRDGVRCATSLSLHRARLSKRQKARGQLRDSSLQHTPSGLEHEQCFGMATVRINIVV